MNDIWHATGRFPLGVSVFPNPATQSRSRSPFLKTVFQFLDVIASVAPTLVSQSVSQSDNQSVSQSLTLSDFHSFGVSEPSGSVPRPQSVFSWNVQWRPFHLSKHTYLPTHHLSTALDWGVIPETCYLWEIQSVRWGDMTFFSLKIFLKGVSF